MSTDLCYAHSRWWQKLNVRSNLSFIRDRIVETYFWINGTSYNRKYSYSRIIATKITAFMTIIDDIFDTYGSTEESMQLAEAINRLNHPSLHQLVFIIIIIHVFYNTFNI